MSAASEPTETAKCACCTAALSKPLVCSLCKKRHFCSRECQVKDWAAGHKRECAGKVTKKKEEEDAGSEDLLIAEVETMIAAANNWLRGMPVIAPSLGQNRTNFRRVVDDLAGSLRGDFCWAPGFDPAFIAALMYEGFLPMANRISGRNKYCLTPKLHRMRCIIDLSAGWLRVRKNTRRVARHFRASIDHDWDGVVAGCLRQHGHSWLYPDLVAALRRMHLAGSVTPLGHDAGEHGVRVQVHSVEIIDDKGRLVAGEIGYSVGGCWTSMSGFTAADDAGSVQCAVLGVLLQSSQLRYWDLGMSMSYKDRMGARNVSRKKFLIMLRAVRDSTATRPLRTPPQPAVLLLRPCCNINDRVRRMPVPERQPDAQGSASGEEVHGTVVGVTNGLFLRVRWDGCEDTTEVRFEDVETMAVSDALLGGLIKSSSMQEVRAAHTGRWQAQIKRRAEARKRHLEHLNRLLNAARDQPGERKISRRGIRVWKKLSRA